MTVWLTLCIVAGGLLLAHIRHRRRVRPADGRTSKILPPPDEERTAEQIADEHRQLLGLRIQILERRFTAVIGRVRSFDHDRPCTRFAARMSELLVADAAERFQTALRGLAAARVGSSKPDPDEKAIEDALDEVAGCIDHLDLIADVRERVVPALSRDARRHANELQRSVMAYRDELEAVLRMHGDAGIGIEERLSKVLKLRNGLAANESLLYPEPLKVVALLFRQLSLLDEIALTSAAAVRRRDRVVDIRTTDILAAVRKEWAAVDLEPAPVMLDGGDGSELRVQWHVILASCAGVDERLAGIRARTGVVRRVCCVGNVRIDDAIDAVCGLERDMKRIERDLAAVVKTMRIKRRESAASLTVS